MLIEVDNSKEKSGGDTECLCVCNNADLQNCWQIGVTRVESSTSSPLINNSITQWASKVLLPRSLSSNRRPEQTHFRRISLRHQSIRNQKLLWPKSRNRPLPSTRGLMLGRVNEYLPVYDCCAPTRRPTTHVRNRRNNIVPGIPCTS